MSLVRAQIGARVLEAAENYSRSEVPASLHRDERSDGGGYCHDDGSFWWYVLKNGANAFGSEWHFDEAAICDWVARVPGLFWEPGSEALRDARPVLSEKIGHWLAFPPLGKSTKVIGGIGTMRLSPAPDGSRLVTLTINLNASAGIPLLVPPDFPVGGCMMNRFRARWEPMPATWSERFPSTRGIPRGYLALQEAYSPRGRSLTPYSVPVLIHPCAIMEYDNRGARLFDFVFATADTSERDWRRDVADFFEQYRNDRDRFGEYLTAGDHIDPMWDARFTSPQALRSVDQHANAHLALLTTRVRESMLGPSVTEAMVRVLAQHSQDDLKRYGMESQTPPSVWFRGGTSADEAVQLVTEARRRNTFELLVEAVAREHPAAFGAETAR